MRRLREEREQRRAACAKSESSDEPLARRAKGHADRGPRSCRWPVLHSPCLVSDAEGGRAEMRFIHTGDWQLGMTRHFLNGDAQPRYSAARRDAVCALGAVAAETGAGV